MQLPKDLITALKNLFASTETFLAPFFKELTSQLSEEVLSLAATSIASFAANPSSLTDPTQRAAMIASLISTAEKQGTAITEAVAGQAVAAAIAHYNSLPATNVGTVASNLTGAAS